MVIFVRPQNEVEERSRIIRNDFVRRYDVGMLREQLYRQQEGICAICKKPMQDSSGIICTVDHAISINMIANWDWKIEKACEVANAQRNLLATHVLCNFAKREADYEEFLATIQRGEVVLGATPELTAEDITALKSAQSERARKASRCVSRETRVKAGRIGGRATKKSTNGRKGNGDGNPARVRNLCQSTKEARRRGGLKTSTKGREYMAELGRRGQLISGRNKDFSSSGAYATNHLRFHVRRDIANPRCALCSEQGLIVAYA